MTPHPRIEDASVALQYVLICYAMAARACLNAHEGNWIIATLAICVFTCAAAAATIIDRDSRGLTT